MLSVLTAMGAPGLPPGWNKYTNQPRTFVRLVQPGGGWAQEAIPFGQIPPIETCDVEVMELTTDPGGFVITQAADGIPTLSVSGSTTPQYADVDIYSARRRAWLGAAEFAWNNLKPNYLGQRLYIFPEDVAIEPATLASMFIDPELEALKVAVLSGPGGSVVNISTIVPGLTNDVNTATVTGTPNTRGIYEVWCRAFDRFNGFVEGLAIWIIGPIAVPNVVGFDPNDALTTINQTYLSGILVPETAGEVVLSQFPIAGADVAPGTEVQIITRIRVPDLFEEALDDAIALVVAAGLAYVLQYRRTASYDEDIVIDQDPASTEYVDAGDQVTLYVSRKYPVSLVKTSCRRRY